MAAYALLLRGRPSGFAEQAYWLQLGVAPTRPSHHWGELFQRPLHCKAVRFEYQLSEVSSSLIMREIFRSSGWRERVPLCHEGGPKRL